MAGAQESGPFYIFFTTSIQPGNKLPEGRCEGGLGLGRMPESLVLRPTNKKGV